MAVDLLLDRFTHNTGKSPQKELFHFVTSGADGGRIQKSYTYAELQGETSALASRLAAMGLQRGDRALLVYPPSLDFMVAFLACLKAGVVAVPVFPPNPARRDTLHMFSKITESSGASFALTNTDYNYMKKLSSVKDALKRGRKMTAAWPEQLTWMITNDKSSKKANTSFPSVQASKNDLAFLQYTSGSTSEPKGVMITHGNLAHNLTIITNELKAANDTVVVSWLPQYHDMGLIGSHLGVLYCGGSGYYMSPLAFLQRPMLWIEAASRYQATHLQAPNFGFRLTARKFQASNYVNMPLNLRSVRHIINAAEPVDHETIVGFEQTFGPFGLRKGVLFPTYGLAEHTVFVCSGGKQRLCVAKEELEIGGKVVRVDEHSRNDASVSKLVGCGFPKNQGVDVRIVDHDTGAELSNGRVGEIWVNSPSKAAGYFNKKQETRADFFAKLKGSEDRFLRTGDLGFLYNEELFICGRLKDLIIVAGRNYYPQDIEATAESVSTDLRPGCSAAFTVDPTAEGDEEVALIMELREVPHSGELTQVCETLANLVRSTINQEHSMSIAQLVFLKPRTVPKTSSGKIARAWCRKGFLHHTLQIVFEKSFTQGGSPGVGSSTRASSDPQSTSRVPLSPEKIAELRAADKGEIANMLTTDVSRVGQLPPDSIDTRTALVTILDSLSLSQFKSRFETAYAVQISDEYLFGESVTIQKLAEVVKLGYAPDDDATGGETNGGSGAVVSQGTAGGLAGAMGCPPGVVCCVIQ